MTKELRLIPGDGPAPCTIMFVGERPGKLEHRARMPFVPWAPAGMEFARQLHRVRLDRQSVYVTNLVKTYSAQPPSMVEIERDSGILVDELGRVAPKVIVTLGAHSTRWFLGSEMAMEKCNGFAYRVGKDQWLMPVVHPAAGLHQSDLAVWTERGFDRLGELLDGGRPEDLAPPEDKETGSYLALETPLAAFPNRVTIDTEGTVARPWGLSIGFPEFPGRAAVYRRAHAGCATGVAQVKEVIFHNALYDLGVLRAMGIKIAGFTDTMVMAHLIGGLPLGLKALAYRLCGMEMESYSEVIAPAQTRLAEVWLTKVIEVAASSTAGLRETLCHPTKTQDWGPAVDDLVLETYGIRTRKRRSLVSRVNKILADHAKPDKETDLRARWAAVVADLPETAAVVEKICGPMPEATLDDLDPAQATTYSGRDADATARIYPILKKMILEHGLDLVLEIDIGAIPMFERMQAVGMKVDMEHFRRLGKELEHEMEELSDCVYFISETTLNLDSPKQVGDLLFKKLKLDSRRKTPTGLDCTDDKVLQALRGAHPVVGMILDYREMGKIKGTYADKLPEFVGAEGRIHPNLNLVTTPTGRPACSKPNLLAMPVRTGLGRRIRQGFVAGEGRVLAAWDLDQIEMRALAHESRDKAMIRAFLTGVDIHKQTAALIYGVRVEDVTQEQRTRAKNVGFGIVYGISAYGLRGQLDARGVTASLQECEKFIDVYLDALPGVRGYMDTTKAHVRRYGYAVDMFGRRRYLPLARSDSTKTREEALRQAINFPIQAGAQGIIKIAMARIWREVLPAMWDAGVRVEPLLQVHDELVFEVEEGLEATLGAMVTAAMSGAVELSVPITARGSVGHTWADLK